MNSPRQPMRVLRVMSQAWLLRVFPSSEDPGYQRARHALDSSVLIARIVVARYLVSYMGMSALTAPQVIAHGGGTLLRRVGGLADELDHWTSFLHCVPGFDSIAGCKCNQSNQADELVLKLLRSLRVLPKTELRKESCKHFIGQSRSIPEWLPTALIEVSSTKTRQHVQGHGNPDNRRGRDLLLRGCHILRLSRLIMATKFCD